MNLDNDCLTLDDLALDLARECVYRYLAATLTDPTLPGWDRVLDPENQKLAVSAAQVLREAVGDEPFALTFGEAPPAQLELEPLVASLQRSRGDLTMEFERTFGLVVPKECPPYETEFHPPAQTFMRFQQMADVAGFYRAFGLTTSALRPERPDHLVLELEFMAVAIERTRTARERSATDPEAREQVEICTHAQQAFVRDHLCWWVPAFAAGLRRKATSGYLHELAGVLAALIPWERRFLDVAAPFQAPPSPAFVERPEEQSGCEGCPAMDRG